MGFSGKTTPRVNLSLTTTKDLSTPRDGVSISNPQSWSDGVGANQCNELFHDTRSVGTGGEDLDLNDAANSLKNAFGDALQLARVKVLYIRNNDTTNNLLVKPSTSNGWNTGFTGTITIKPGGTLLLTAHDADGYVVTAGSVDSLNLASSASTVSYDIVIAGGKS